MTDTCNSCMRLWTQAPKAGCQRKEEHQVQETYPNQGFAEGVSQAWNANQASPPGTTWKVEVTYEDDLLDVTEDHGTMAQDLVLIAQQVQRGKTDGVIEGGTWAISEVDPGA
jgi:hypothetical protein